MKVAFVGSGRAEFDQENRYLKKTIARDFKSLPCSKFIKFGPLKRKFPADSSDWKNLVSNISANIEKLPIIGRVDAIVAVIPLENSNNYCVRVYCPSTNKMWVVSGHRGYLELGPFANDRRGAKNIAVTLGVLELIGPTVYSDTDQKYFTDKRNSYVRSLQQMERRFDLYRNDLFRDARPILSYSLKRLDGWLQLTLGRVLSSENRIRRSKNILLSLLEEAPNDVPVSDLAKTWSLLASANRELGRDSSGVELLEQSVDAARNAVELWGMLSPAEEDGQRAELLGLMSDCLVLIGERQTDDDRLSQAVELLHQSLEAWRRTDRPDKSASASAVLGNVYCKLYRRSSNRLFLSRAQIAFENAVADISGASVVGWEAEASRYLEALGDVQLELGQRELDPSRLNEAVLDFERVVGYNFFGRSLDILKRLQAKQARARYFSSILTNDLSQAEQALKEFEYVNRGLFKPGRILETEFDAESVLLHALLLMKFAHAAGDVDKITKTIKMLEFCSGLPAIQDYSSLHWNIEQTKGEAYLTRAGLTGELSDWLSSIATFDELIKQANSGTGAGLLKIQIHRAECLFSVAKHPSNSEKNYLHLAIEAFQRLLSRRELEKNSLQAGYCYFGLAECFSMRSDWKQRPADTKEAIHAYEKALEIWTSAGELTEQVRTLCRLGTLHRNNIQLGGAEALRKSHSAFGEALDIVGRTELSDWAGLIAENFRKTERELDGIRLRGNDFRLR